MHKHTDTCLYVHIYIIQACCCTRSQQRGAYKVLLPKHNTEQISINTI